MFSFLYPLVSFLGQKMNYDYSSNLKKIKLKQIKEKNIRKRQAKMANFSDPTTFFCIWEERLARFFFQMQWLHFTFMCHIVSLSAQFQELQPAKINQSELFSFNDTVL